MKMRNFLTSALVVTSLCIASVAMADLARVNIVMDISDPNNVTITDYEESGAYGGAYFAIDALEFYGAVAEIDLTGPMPYVYDPLPWGLGILIANGDMITMLATSTGWMEYGVSCGFGRLVESSNPADFYCVDGEDIYPRSFLILDADEHNGLGTKLLGTIIPEPTSMSLLAFGALAIIRHRRFSSENV